MINLKKRILHHLASQLANVLYTIKHDHKFPIRYPLVLMSLSGIFIRLFVTEDIIISTLFSILFASTMHLLAVFYIVYYIMPNEKKMKKFINFIKDHREDPENKKDKR